MKIPYTGADPEHWQVEFQFLNSLRDSAEVISGELITLEAVEAVLLALAQLQPLPD